MRDFTHAIIDKVFVFDQLTSTTIKAQQILKEAQQGNFLVIANEQQTGKGRAGHEWYSPLGGLWITLGMYNLFVESNLTILIGITIHKALSELYPSLKNRLMIKWPNDIYLDDRKVAGIHCQYNLRSRYHLIGVGIDTDIAEMPDYIKNNTTSLRIALKSEIDNRIILELFLDYLQKELPNFLIVGLNGYIGYFNDHHYLKEKQVTVHTQFQDYEGIAQGINLEGALLLRINDKITQPFYAGDVSISRSFEK